MKIIDIQPMCAASTDSIQIGALMVDDNWIAETKEDGSRYLMHITDTGNRFFSRRISVKGGRVEKTDNIPHLRDMKKLDDYSYTVLDGEVKSPTNDFGDTVSIMGAKPDKAIKRQKEIGKAVFVVFDCLYYRGVNIMDKPLRERRQIAEDVVAPLFSKYIYFVRNAHSTLEKSELLQTVWDEGGEGIILKNLDAKYVPDGRDKNTWIKVKRQKDWSVFIVGFTEGKGKYKGLIGAIKFGVYDKGKVVEIGQCSGMNDDIRQELSRGKEYHMAKVFDVEGQQVFKHTIRHPRFKGFRHDVDIKQCTLEKIT